jgi:putrescine transport system ATP-binding protein
VGAVQGGALNAASRPGADAPWRDPDAVPFLRIQGLTKRFGPVLAVDDVTLDIFRGEFFALLGGSGSGKSTLLRCLAGFETQDAGTIVIDGQDMAGVAPYARPVNMMFQSYALFPHMSVFDNIAFGLRQENASRADIRDRVAEMLALVQLVGLEKRRPHELSGGQKQRVALARALAKRPKLLLLDEPLGALDKNLREATQFELVNIQEKLGVTFVIVTHDQEEAMTMATRLAVMERGALAQLGTPSEVYEFPNSRFVAEFLGTANIFAGIVEGRRIASTELGAVFESDADLAKPEGARVFVAVRPEKMRIRKGEAPPAAPNTLAGTVQDIAYYGDFFMYLVALPDGRTVRVSEPNLRRITEMPITWHDQVVIDWPPHASVVLPE